MGYFRCSPTQLEPNISRTSEIIDTAAIISENYGTKQTPLSPNNCYGMFRDMRTFNNNVYIGNGVINCESMFMNCSNLNQSIQIPDNVVVCNSMFYTCVNLDQKIIISNNAKYCRSMFTSCQNLNRRINIPLNVENCSYMFAYCYKFNQNITIPANAKDCSYMFRGCNGFGGTNIRININVNNSQTQHNFSYMLLQKNNSLRINIFCNNLSLVNGTTEGKNCIITPGITWTSMTNGYYNSVYNVYLYKNYSGTW